MATTLKLFSLEGKGLKLDSAADIEAHISPLREMQDVEEVRFLGNTLGVDACKVLGEVLETKKSLQVRSIPFTPPSWSKLTGNNRSRTWPIYSQAAY